MLSSTEQEGQMADAESSDASHATVSAEAPTAKSSREETVVSLAEIAHAFSLCQ